MSGSMDKKMALRQIRNSEAVFLDRISLARSIFLVHQNGNDHVFVYNKNRKCVEYMMTPEWFESEYAKRLITAASLCRTVKQKPLRPVGPFPPCEVPILTPKILGWKPVYKPKEVADDDGMPRYKSAHAKTQGIIRELMKRDGELCVYCQRKTYLAMYDGEPKATIDHFVPKSKGGINHIDNYVLACSTCNNKKKDLEPLEFMKSIWGADLRGCPHKISGCIDELAESK